MITENDIYKTIAAMYKGEAWVVLPQVRDGTAYGTDGREADALVFSVWPSRGLKVYGFEIKTHRGDFLHELKQPEKAESIARFCNEWYIVTAPGIAELSEIPPSWGWYESDGKSMTLKKAAEQLPNVDLSRIFVMSVMRNIAKNYVPAIEVENRAETLARAQILQNELQAAHDVKNAREALAAISDFKKASGVDLMESWSFSPEQVGTVVRLILDNSLPCHLKNISEAAEKIGSLIVALDNVRGLVGKRDEMKWKKKRGRNHFNPDDLKKIANQTEAKQ